MSPLPIALLVFLVLGVLATWRLRATPAAAPARDHTQLAQLRWREFVHLVLKAMAARGYRALAEPGLPGDGIPGEGGDILLARAEQRVLLSCKYAQARALGAEAVMGLSSAAALRGATEVVLVTPGRFDDEAIRIARQQRIELIDGEDLWPEVRPYVAHPARASSAPTAAPASRRTLLLAWAGAALAGGLAWLALQPLQAPDGPPVEAPSASSASNPKPPAATMPAAAVSDTAVAASTVATSTVAANAVPADAAELARRRTQVVDALSTLAGVERALWVSQSTLVVHLTSEENDPVAALCEVMLMYPELAASRLQLQPPAGSSRPVRFRQCQAY